jgi:hypothetical protein
MSSCWQRAVAPAVEAPLRPGWPPRLAVTAVVLALVVVLTPGLIIFILRAIDEGQ